MNLLITGGAGFIGSNFTRYIARKYPDWKIIVLDKLNYRGRRENLLEVEGRPKFHFIHGDICIEGDLAPLLPGIDWVINFAAETFVDRSIMSADDFVRTDVLGVFTIMEAMREHSPEGRLLHLSTDEVYGEILEGKAGEDWPLAPRNPYSASKAGGEMLVSSYINTHNFSAIIARPSNNFGPYQFPENFIPLFITNALEKKPLPLYGDGRQVRDWLFVEDCCVALEMLMEKGELGEVYNIGGGEERENILVAELICQELGVDKKAIKLVKDRPGHDRRYALDSGRLASLGWAPSKPFEERLTETVRWYVENVDWWKPLKSGEYKEFYRQWYGERL